VERREREIWRGEEGGEKNRQEGAENMVGGQVRSGS
jgi:hypothetical protein